jgi:hypothetical protein
MQVYTTKELFKENFDQVFDGKLWSCKRVFIGTHTNNYSKLYIDNISTVS